MKKIIIMAAAFLSAVCLNSCKEDEIAPEIIEPVDLTMTVENSSLIKGDELVLVFATANPEETANETFGITLSVTETSQDVSSFFVDFPKTVTFEEGESQCTVRAEVAATVTGKHLVTIAASSRGYSIAPQELTVNVADYHYVTMSVRNNSDLEVDEGDKFVLVAAIDAEAEEDITITVTPKAGEEDNYSGIPDGGLKIVVPKGELTAESSEIQMLMKEGQNSGKTPLTLNFAVSSATFKMTSETMVINKVVAEPLGTDVADERYLYADPDVMFVSEANEAAVQEWNPDAKYVVMKEGDPHPNAANVLDAGKWKFYRAYEFHHIAALMTSKTQSGYTNDEYPAQFADQNTEAVETAGAVDNTRYAWVTQDGYLRMISLKEETVSVRNNTSYPFGTSAFYACSFREGKENSYSWKSSNVRILPGMRIETRARIRGNKTGMLPGIWLQGNKQYVAGNSWPIYGEIDIMENNTETNNRNTVEQTFHVGPEKNGSHYNPTTGGVAGLNGVDEYNIFWVEWQDANTVTMGVNGKETIKITKEEVEGKGYTWPFDLTFNPEGCYFLLTMMYLGKDAPNASGYEGITHDQARLPEHNAKDSVIPRMEIDWVRFYVDDSYLSTVGNYKFNNSIFY